jgi:DNA-binding transcriptional regulator YhcF (GntR family)
MIVEIDHTSAVPPYEQLRDQIARTILSGVLAPGDQLPTIRQIAADLHLAPGTVARAYRELERERLVVSHRRRGTVVANPARRADPARDEQVAAAARRYAAFSAQLGLDAAAALDHVREALSQLRSTTPAAGGSGPKAAG